MRNFRETHTLAMALGLFLTFSLAGGVRAQKRGIRFLVKPAVHEYWETDRAQELANAFMYEGKFDEYSKWEIENRNKSRKIYDKIGKKMKACKDEDEKDSLDELRKELYHEIDMRPNPYPKHQYVVIIRPSFKPTCGFAVEKEKLVYMVANSQSKKSDSMFAIEASIIEISPEVAEAMRSLIDNITLSARITDDTPKRMDGSTYDIIRGYFPTHMVESRGGGTNDDEGAVCRLLEEVCEAAKNKDAASINAQLQEIKRLSAVYSALKDF